MAPEICYVGRLVANRYQLLRFVARGGQGEVWEAQDRLLKTPVALKILESSARSSAQSRREISILRVLHLPGVVPLLDGGMCEGRPFIVMKWLEGRPFPGMPSRHAAGVPGVSTTMTATHTITEGSISGLQPVHEGERIGWEALSGPAFSLLETMARVHEAGVVHRDLKPSNVLVDADGRVMVLDFGIALEKGFDDRVNTQGGLVGTPKYISPEQIQRHELDARTDLYSIGLMLFEALTGQIPHDSEHPSALFFQRTNVPAPSIRKMLPELPEAVGKVIDRMLSLDPRQRPASAAEVLSGLRAQSWGQEQDFLCTQAWLEPLVASQDATPSPAFSLEALNALFSGSDRLLHLREDAARCLWERTEGERALVASELSAWVRAGLARSKREGLFVPRDALDRLMAGLDMRLRHRPPSTMALSPLQAEILNWYTFSFTRLSPAHISILTGQPLSLIQEQLLRLKEVGALRALEDGSMEPLVQAGEPWMGERRRRAHEHIGNLLEPGHPDRLFHFLAAEAIPQLAEEAIAFSRNSAHLGRLGSAIAKLHEALLALREWPDEHAYSKEVILVQWAKLAFAERTKTALDRVDYELCRTAADGVEESALLSRLKNLINANLTALGQNGQHALDEADSIPPFEDPELERWRHWVRLRGAAHRQASPAFVSAVLVELERWAKQSKNPLARACFAGGMGILRYNQNRFVDAARWHARAAQEEYGIDSRLAGLMNSGSALLEAFRFEEAIERGHTVQALAAQHRRSYFEGRAEWLIRTAQYRLDTPMKPDLELVEAAFQVGVPELSAQICFLEAAIAWRVLAFDTAAELSASAVAIWSSSGRQWTGLLARCLWVASTSASRELSDEEIGGLAGEALSCTSVRGIGLQALGLLKWAYSRSPSLCFGLPKALFKGIPRQYWSKRMDVLSVNESRGIFVGGP